MKNTTEEKTINQISRYFFKGRILSFFERFNSENSAFKPLENNYKYLKSYAKYGDRQPNYTIALYKKDNQKVIVKRLLFKFKNLKYEQLANEYQVLKFLETHQSKIKKAALRVIFPKVYDFSDKKGEVHLTREYINGTRLNSYKADFKVQVLKSCIDSIAIISNENLKDDSNLNRRTALSMYLTFPLFLFTSMVRNPKMIPIILKSARYFIKKCLSFKTFKSKYVFSHRDLHSNNILVNGKSIVIIDSEIATYSEEDTDLAIIARDYVDELSQDQLINLIKEKAISKNRFLKLTIFYTLQLLATENKNDNFYTKSIIYLPTLLNKILPQLEQPNMPGKKFLNASLN